MFRVQQLCAAQHMLQVNILEQLRFFHFFKEVSYAQESCICLNINTVQYFGILLQFKITVSYINIF